MKTKNKIIVLLEIAIVLCSIFLVALPTIAAEQTAQEVSAYEATAASEDDNVLGIYGNANEDDTIDMRDLTYVKLIFFGKKSETELADAKYDGKINPLDFIQIKLIIVGKEKELTVEIPATKLQAEQIITVQKPVERIVVLSGCEAQVLRSINAADKIVGVGKGIQDDEVFYPELSKLPIIGQWMGPGLDYEAILTLKPDVFLPFIGGPGYIDEEKLPGVTVIGMDFEQPLGFTERVRLLGYILDRKEEAEEYINWQEDLINTVKSRTEGLSGDQKPRVFQWAFFKPGGAGVGYTVCKGSRVDMMCDMAGGINIAGDIQPCHYWVTVDSEWVIDQNPEIIIAHAYSIPCGYDTDDPSEMAAAREDVLNRPELAEVTAVKNGRVYIITSATTSGCLFGTVYQAKWFHPDVFEDLDPKAIHQKYLTRFQGLDIDLDKQGVFVYHPEEHPEGH